MSNSDFPPVRDAATLRNLKPRLQPGYYPRFQVLEQQRAWDEATKRVVLERVEKVPQIRFFSQAEALFWACVFEHLIPQADRAPERRIPIVPRVDVRLYENRTAGYRYADMPHDRDAYRMGREAIDAEAHQAFGRPFLACSYHERELLLERIHDEKPQAAGSIWEQMSVKRFWTLVTSDVAEVYYSHPWAWDEIGFGGPAYPRGYMRLERGEPEPWESDEQRYHWLAPADARS